MGWQGIDGHDDVVTRFVAAEARGRIAGTYLFIGPEGIGKGAFTKALAKSLVCLAPRPGLIACGACASCVQAAAGSHPDIDIVSKPDDRSTIPLEVFIGDREHRMREGLCWRILLRPALGGRKVAVILDADHLAEEGANCLLKTLEEPPDGAVIILVGTALERQLPTIRSRSQIIRFSPLDTEIVRRVLAAEAIDEVLLLGVGHAAVKDVEEGGWEAEGGRELGLEPEEGFDAFGEEDDAVRGVHGLPWRVGVREEADEALARWLRARTTEVVARAVQAEGDPVGEDATFESLGVDSILAVEIIERLNRDLGLTLRTPDLFNHPSVRRLVRRILATAEPGVVQRLRAAALPPAALVPAPVGATPAAPVGGVSSSAAAPAGGPEPIAIIGMAGQFPDADDLEEFWANLAAGRDSF
jgi:acyl carrier protein